MRNLQHATIQMLREVASTEMPQQWFLSCESQISLGGFFVVSLSPRGAHQPNITWDSIGAKPPGPSYIVSMCSSYDKDLHLSSGGCKNRTQHVLVRAGSAWASVNTFITNCGKN